MFNLEYPWYELVIRALSVFVFVHLVFRLIGKKQLGEMSPLDFVLLLIVSESVNGALIGQDSSVLGGFISAFTLIGLSYVIDYFVFKSKKFEKFVEGEPRIVIKNGKVIQKVLDDAKITMSELKNSLRERDIGEISKVKFAILETNGKITAIPKDA